MAIVIPNLIGCIYVTDPEFKMSHQKYFNVLQEKKTEEFGYKILWYTTHILHVTRDKWLTGGCIFNFTVFNGYINGIFASTTGSTERWETRGDRTMTCDKGQCSELNCDMRRQLWTCHSLHSTTIRSQKKSFSSHPSLSFLLISCLSPLHTYLQISQVTYITRLHTCTKTYAHTICSLYVVWMFNRVDCL